MPCPFFEPRSIAVDPTHLNARLPLLDEYEGHCWIAAESVPVPAALRFRFCNHGYSDEVCPREQKADEVAALRFHVTKASAEELEILCIGERDFAPVSHFRSTYSVPTGALEPALLETCMQAQAKAFCKSFLAHARER